MIPKPAQYLLRVDDLCPSVWREGWERLRNVIERLEVHPILAVVPDNDDPELKQSPADPAFWEQVRSLEARGADIAVHGYRHVCESTGRSLLGIHGRTEFAGVKYETQRNWIRAGFEMLRGRGLQPRLWIAPRHGFDRNTMRALAALGVGYISDGYARVPFRRQGIAWIPQQLWGPVAKNRGLWTICIHPQTADSFEVQGLARFIEEHREQFTSFDRVIREFPPKPLGLGEWLYAEMAQARIRIRNRRRRGAHGNSSTNGAEAFGRHSADSRGRAVPIDPGRQEG